LSTQPLPDESQAVKTNEAPAAPAPTDPVGDTATISLWRNVRDTLYALPAYFKSDLAVSGVLATDLFTFNSSLGATIEQQVVAQLNQLRRAWDPDDAYPLYRFERQAQQFPDVVLRSNAPGLDPTPKLGIELKGWYALAKEREPSFRYVVTPKVCSELDLLVVFPWALSNVVSGSPILFEPYVVGARFAAEYRNWHWQFKMIGKGDKTIRVSQVAHYYPSKSELISDRAVKDDGGNFGRFARTDLMNDYISNLFTHQLSGIPLDAWQRFFRVFTEKDPSDKLNRLIDRLIQENALADISLSVESLESIRTRLRDVIEFVRNT